MGMRRRGVIFGVLCWEERGRPDMGSVRVEVELPEELLLTARIPEEQASEELRKLVVLEFYRRGTISLGKACELAGISKWEFFEMNETLQIPIHYTEEDWGEDQRTVEEMVGT